MINIWHFPSWYPYPKNLTLGSFVKSQVEAAALFSRQVVFFVYEDASIKHDFLIKIKERNHILEVIVAIRPSSSKFGSLRKKKKAYNLAINKIVNKNILPHFIHAHSISFASFVARKMADKFRVKLILSTHWSGFLSASGAFEKMPFYKKKIWINHAKKASCILCVSEVLKQDMILYGFDHPNYRIVPNVVEGKWLKTQENHREDEGKFVFLNVSDMVDNIKNISGLMRSFDFVWQENNTVQLWLVGDGVDFENMKNIAGNLPSREAIFFYGRLSPEDVLNLYPKIDSTIINSRYETFSVVAAESIFAGKPVITTRCGGPEEFVSKNEGITINVDDENELQEAMLTMISTASKYDSKAMHQYIDSKFSKERIAEQLQEIYC